MNPISVQIEPLSKENMYIIAIAVLAGVIVALSIYIAKLVRDNSRQMENHNKEMKQIITTNLEASLKMSYAMDNCSKIIEKLFEISLK
jgi:Na+/H+ antiporter NhaA